MEKRFNCRVNTVTIPIDEYRLLTERSIRYDLVKSIIREGDRYLMDTDMVRRILELPTDNADGEDSEA